jgi:hypothetical protein
MVSLSKVLKITRRKYKWQRGLDLADAGRGLVVGCKHNIKPMI